MFHSTLIFAWLGTALVLAAPTELRSPCPELFQYDTLRITKPGQWEGTLTLLSDADLHGAWIRLIFDSKLAELTVSDKEYEVVHDEKLASEVLIKNRNAVLKNQLAKILHITVKYHGDKAPQLSGFRLNAKIVCPIRNSDNGVLYRGDAQGTYFLQSILQNSKASTFDLERRNCGKAHLVDPDFKTINEGHWPWQAVVTAKTEDKVTFLCEATLISEETLLTSAHCVTWENSEVPVPATLLSVYVGGFHPNNESKTHQNSVLKIIVHPGYSVRNLQNDIALIKLQHPVEVNDKVGPVCLPTKDSELEKNFVVGYGVGPNKHFQKLEVAKIKSISEDKCLKREPTFAPLIGDNEYCASYSQDLHECVGNSGSGVFNPRRVGYNIVWELTGIVNVGRGLLEKLTCTKDSTILLSKVAHYLKWIKANAL